MPNNVHIRQIQLFLFKNNAWQINRLTVRRQNINVIRLVDKDLLLGRLGVRAGDKHVIGKTTWVQISGRPGIYNRLVREAVFHRWVVIDEFGRLIWLLMLVMVMGR